MDHDAAAAAFGEFVSVVRALRTPGTGCPWDLEQDHHSLRGSLVEEAYEVIDAIDRRDDRALREELGDLLLQVVLHAQLAADRGVFAITDVVRDITAKMVRRHPHVFGSVQVSGSAEVLHNWEQIKAAEKAAAGLPTSPADALARVPQSLPALLRAQRVAAKAAKLRPDGASPGGTLDGVREQWSALEGAIAAPAAPSGTDGAGPASPDDARTRHERVFGELLFRLCQLARQVGVSAEDSLRDTTRRFVDEVAQGGSSPGTTSAPDR